MAVYSSLKWEGGKEISNSAGSDRENIFPFLATHSRGKIIALFTIIFHHILDQSSWGKIQCFSILVVRALRKMSYLHSLCVSTLIGYF
jgi:hypothetical protein